MKQEQKVVMLEYIVEQLSTLEKKIKETYESLEESISLSDQHKFIIELKYLEGQVDTYLKIVNDFGLRTTINFDSITEGFSLN